MFQAFLKDPKLEIEIKQKLSYVSLSKIMKFPRSPDLLQAENGLWISCLPRFMVLYSISFLGDHLDMNKADDMQTGIWSKGERNRDCIFQRMEMS